MKEQEARVTASRKRLALAKEKRFEQCYERLEAGRAMIRDELTPAIAHRNELDQRKLAVKHAEWTEKVFDKLQTSITKAVDSKTSKEVHREANEAFEKFLQESQKRQMFFESCDYSQYDPFEKSHARVAVGKLDDPVKKTQAKLERERALLSPAKRASTASAASGTSVHARPQTALGAETLIKSTQQVMRDNTQRLAVTAWRHSEVLTRMGRNPPPATYNIEEYDAAVEAAEKHVHEFGIRRDRVLGDYYRELSTEERLAAVADALPRGSKRMGLKPEDVGTALLAHMHDAVTGAGAAAPARP